MKGSGNPTGGDAVGRLEAASADLHDRARAAWGITGEGDPPRLREAVARSGAGWYPLVALGLLGLVDRFQFVVLQTLSPEISAALGISRGGLAGLTAVQVIAATLATLPLAAYVQRKARRAAVALVTGVAWSLTTLASGFVSSLWGLAAVLVADGVSTGSVEAVHPPLLSDTYPPEGRVRMLSFHRALERAGATLGPLLVALLTAWAGLTWRGVFVVMGGLSLVAVAFCFRLRDPGFGRWDAGSIAGVAGGAVGNPKSKTSRAADIGADLGVFETLRKLMAVPTLRALYGAISVVGLIFIPLGTYFSFFLDERWDLGPGARGIFFAATPLFVIAALGVFGRWGEGLYRRDPSRLVKASACLFALSSLALAGSVLSANFALMFVLFGMAGALTALVFLPLQTIMLSIVPPRMRPQSSAAAEIFVAAVGGLGGLLLLGGIDRRFGLTTALVSIAVPQLAAAALIWRASAYVNGDLDRTIAEAVEEIEVSVMSEQGVSFPVLRCRDIDFSYGTNQVLFEVDLSVDEGEIVALLGTNGAGKSSLLRVVSGLGLPAKGTVRLDGRDITFADTRRRLSAGVVSIPAEGSVFGSLTVLENLRIFCRSSPHAEGRIDRCFEVFPRLRERTGRKAATLSGGEQRMLGLCQALLLRPRLLLIDELTTGLSPKVVEDLTGALSAINREGASILLVEQSVDVALSLAGRAYFLEKGRVLFEGSSSELAHRSDLLRSVFLAGTV